MTLNYHIERIYNTLANGLANLDPKQIMVLSDQDHELCWTDQSSPTRFYTAAKQRYYNGSVWTYCDNTMANLSLTSLAAGGIVKATAVTGALGLAGVDDYPAHSMLSATHGDSTAAFVQRGDLITGQGSTPAWVRLAKGSTAEILRSDGTDIGWASLSTAGIAPAAHGVTTNYLPYAASSTTWGTSPIVTDGTVVSVGGAVDAGMTLQVCGQYFSVVKNHNSTTGFYVTNTTDGTASSCTAAMQGVGNARGYFRLMAPSFTTVGMNEAGTFCVQSLSNDYGMNVGTYDNKELKFWANNIKQAWLSPNADLPKFVFKTNTAYGQLLCANVDTSVLQMSGGADNGSGQGQFNLYGKSHATLPGVIDMFASAYTFRYASSPYTIRMIINSSGSVGIGFTTPLSTLCVNGGVHIGGESAVSDNNLLVDGSATIGTLTGMIKGATGLLSAATAGTDYIAGGVGTANYVAKFSASGVLANSQIIDDGTTVGIGIAPASGYALKIQNTMGSILTINTDTAKYSGLQALDNTGSFWTQLWTYGAGVGGTRFGVASAGATDFLSYKTTAFLIGTQSTTATRIPIYIGQKTTGVDEPIISIDTSGNVGIGFTSPLSKLCVNGGVHIGGESDAGDNNLLVDGTISVLDDNAIIFGTGGASTDGTIYWIGAQNTLSISLHQDNAITHISAPGPGQQIKLTASGLGTKIVIGAGYDDSLVFTETGSHTFFAQLKCPIADTLQLWNSTTGSTATDGSWIGLSTNQLIINNKEQRGDAILIQGLGFTAITAGTDGSAAQLGFYGTSAISKQTGVAVTAAGIHAALVNLGLIAA